MLPNKELAISRINRHLKYVDGHYLFTGSKMGRGYGRIKIHQRKYSVIRLSLALKLNLDYYDWSWQANHIDSCPHKDCCNTNHLYKGTHSENMRDSVRMGTHQEARRTHCSKGHLLQGRRKNGIRYCLTCNRERVKRYKIA